MATTFTPDQQLPDILRQYPQVRAVFDRYGLHGCGGVNGPAESVSFFARSHGVEVNRLLLELEQAAKKPLAPSSSAPPRPEFGDIAYKPFFIAGMAVFLLAGVVVGTLMLAWMSADTSHFAPGIRRMNAHANAMVYGFAGMFILGFGYQALPRFRHTRLWRPRLALISLFLLISGVALRFGGEFFGQQGLYEPALPLAAFVTGIVGTLLQLAAFVVFAVIMWKTLRTDGRLRMYERYVFAGVAWFVVSIVYSLWLFIHFNSTGTFGGMVAALAIYQEPLRIIQMYGAIGLIIIGVMLRFLPAVFGFRDPGERLYGRMFWVINAGVLLSAVAFMTGMAASRGVIDPALASAGRGGYVLGSLLLAVGMLTLVAAFAPWRRARLRDRSIKFIKAAQAWLAVSLLLMLLEPLYIALVQGTFGHGYHFGMRHAYTIGFITMMIVAVSIKVVPNLNGVDPARLRPLWAVFALINLSLIWRVGGEIAADFNPAWLTGLHYSAAAAGVAVLIWGAHLVRIMLKPPVVGTEKLDDITPATTVASVVETWPDTLGVFVANGFTLLTNPVARRTIARTVSLEQVCRMHNKDVQKLVHELRVAAKLASAACADAAEVTPLLDPETPVEEAARMHPATVAVFTKLGMDVCCGGADSIRNAVEHGGMNLPEVMGELEAAIRKDQQRSGSMASR